MKNIKIFWSYKSTSERKVENYELKKVYKKLKRYIKMDTRNNKIWWHWSSRIETFDKQYRHK